MNLDSHALPLGRAFAAAFVLALLLAAGCSEKGGTNVDIPFRVVLIEPVSGSTNVPCGDTIRVTFNGPIDTTAVFDDDYPRYFIAGINSGGVLEPGTFLSNSDRTVNLPFTFVASTSFQFTFLQAQGENGRTLETPAETTFETAPPGPPGCP